MNFQISEKQAMDIRAWIKKLRKTKPEPMTAIGGALTFCFTPTTIGVAVEVIDCVSGEKLDITEDW